MTGAPSVSQRVANNLGRELSNDVGAFLAAPIGGLLWGFGAFTMRISVQWMLAKVRGHRFDAFDRPPAADPSFFTGPRERSFDENEPDPVTVAETPSLKGKFL